MKRRVAFIGLSGPLGYDYRNSTDQVHPADQSSPNPVLENVSGLLVCYDELLFLSPHFCPADMRELPYVRFISDDRALLPRVLTSYQQFEDELRDLHWGSRFEFRKADQILRRMTGKRRQNFAIDNHTHSIHIGGRLFTGNSATLHNLVFDLGMSAALDLTKVDVVMNSVALAALVADSNSVAPAAYFDHWKHEAVTQLVNVASPNTLGPRGSYHPALEDLRIHPHVESFRSFLQEADTVDKDGRAFARETSRLADKYVSEMSIKYLRGRRKFYSIGSIVVGGALNAIHPGLGTLGTAPLSILEFLELQQARRKMSWAPFVFDSRIGRMRIRDSA